MKILRRSNKKFKRNGWYKDQHCTYHYHNDKSHRMDGPAVIGTTNPDYKEWYIDGNFIDVNSQEQFEKSISYKKYKLRAFS